MTYEAALVGGLFLFKPGVDIRSISAFSSFEVDFNLFDLSIEAERAPIEIIERNHGAKIDADIEGFAGRKRRRHSALYRVVANLVAIYFKYDISGSAGLGDRGIYFDVDACRRVAFPLSARYVRSMIIMLYS